MPLNPAWTALSHLGNSGLMLPAAVIVAAWLQLNYGGRDAWRFLAVLAIAIGVVIASKLAFLGWGLGVRTIDFTGVSGHAMLASAVLPVVAYLFLPARHSAWRWAAAGVGLAAGVATGVARVVVGAHSPAESAAGCLIGAAVAFLAIRSLKRSTLSLPPAWAALPVLAFVLLLAFGPHWNVEGLITRVALAVSGHEQAFSRAMWSASGA